MYNEIEGDLIGLAKKGDFDVVAHGANCHCKMGRGIAPQMAKAFGCDKYRMEGEVFVGDVNKLGQIDYKLYFNHNETEVWVVNAYTQYNWATETVPIDYEALTLCMRKMNFIFKGKHIGLPKIGAGLAGGDWDRIKLIIQAELKDCDITIVIYKP